MSTDCPVFPEGYKESAADKVSGTETYDFNNGVVTGLRVFRGPWNRRRQFLAEFLPSVVVDNNGNIVTTSGAVYPDNPAAVAFKAEVKGKLKAGHEGEDGQLSWDEALITIHYSTQTYGIGPIPGGDDEEELPNIEILIEEFDSSYTIVTIPGSAAKFGSNGVWRSSSGETFAEQPSPATPPQNKVVPLINYRLTQTTVISPNWGAMHASLGKVNTNIFYLPDGYAYGRVILGANPQAEITGSNPATAYFNTFYSGHFRYDGPSGSRKYTLNNGITAWQITHKFVLNPMGWNNYIDERDGLVKAIGTRDGQPLYLGSNLNEILYTPVPPIAPEIDLF